VRHVGEELGLVLAGRLELAALHRDLVEEAGVLDGEGGLGGEGLEDLDGLRGELARGLAEERQAADDLLLAQERHGEESPVTGFPQGGPDMARVGARPRDVPDLGRLAGHRGAAHGPFPLVEGRRLQRGHDDGIDVLGGADVERLAGHIVLVDGAAIRTREFPRPGHDRLQHGLHVQGGAHGPADLAEARELARPARGEAVDPASYYFRTVPPSSRGRRPTRGSPHEDFLSRVFLRIRCTRPATARTLRGAASQMVTAESRLQAMAIQNTSR
jgi:hypothetical protein